MMLALIQLRKSLPWNLRNCVRGLLAEAKYTVEKARELPKIVEY
jgi:hypothetical protein